VAPPTRTNPIPGWTEAIELKSAGVSHLAAQTRTKGPHGPLTTSLLRPTLAVNQSSGGAREPLA